jgi:hypothetical protein
VRASSALFGESTGRAIVTYPPEAQAAVPAAAKKAGVPFAHIGRVGGQALRIAIGKNVVIDEKIAALAQIWTTAFAAAMEAADVL